jgi:ribosomal protein L37AE/L43A
MPEHFTKNTISATYWCAKCNKATLHHVDSGRRGPCYTCMEKLESAATQPQPPAETQLDLWGKQ